MFTSYLGQQFDGARHVVQFHADRIHGGARFDISDSPVRSHQILVRNDVQILGLQRKLLLPHSSLTRHLDVALEEQFIAFSGDGAGLGRGEQWRTILG